MRALNKNLIDKYLFIKFFLKTWYKHGIKVGQTDRFFGLLTSMLELSQVNCWPGSMLSYSAVNLTAPSPFSSSMCADRS
jgi:hypothetical protein